MALRSCGSALGCVGQLPCLRQFASAEAATATDKIYINGMKFWARHGVLPEETSLGQPFEVDAVLHVDLRAAGRSDQLSDTLSYADAYTRIKSEVEGAPAALLERVAHRTCSALLAAHPSLAAVELGIRKGVMPGVPGALLQSVGIWVKRGRADCA